MVRRFNVLYHSKMVDAVPRNRKRCSCVTIGLVWAKIIGFGAITFFVFLAESERSQPISERTCHRKGCSTRFLPRRPYQKFCLDPTCVVQLRRWPFALRFVRCLALLR